MHVTRIVTGAEVILVKNVWPNLRNIVLYFADTNMRVIPKVSDSTYWTSFSILQGAAEEETP